MPRRRIPFSDDPWGNEIEDESDIVDKASSYLNHPTYVTILITASLYIVISAYYASYFYRLSLPFNMLNLPYTFYLNAGYGILIVILLLVPLAIIYLIADDIWKRRKHSMKVIILTLMPWGIFWIACLIGTIICLMPSLDFLVFLKLFIIQIASLWTIKYMINNINKSRKERERLILASFLILVISTSMTSISDQLGDQQAQNLIRGDGYEINFTLKNENIGISKSTFMLAAQSDNKYYLVEKNNTIPISAKLFIIPMNETKILTLKRQTKLSNTSVGRIIISYTGIISKDLQNDIKRRCLWEE